MNSVLKRKFKIEKAFIESILNTKQKRFRALKNFIIDELIQKSSKYKKLSKQNNLDFFKSPKKDKELLQSLLSIYKNKTKEQALKDYFLSQSNDSTPELALLELSIESLISSLIDLSNTAGKRCILTQKTLMMIK
ncbi:MAG: hypothetical protein ACP5SC_04325 [Desulfurella sp.]